MKRPIDFLLNIYFRICFKRYSSPTSLIVSFIKCKKLHYNIEGWGQMVQEGGWSWTSENPKSGSCFVIIIFSSIRPWARCFLCPSPTRFPCAYCNLAFCSIYHHGDVMSHLQSREDNGRRGTVHDGSVLDSLAVELTFSHSTPDKASGTPREVTTRLLLMPCDSTQGLCSSKPRLKPSGAAYKQDTLSLPLFQAQTPPESHVHSPLFSSWQLSNKWMLSFPGLAPILPELMAFRDL